jgi:hypothetical protein
MIPVVTGRRDGTFGKVQEENSRVQDGCVPQAPLAQCSAAVCLADDVVKLKQV